MAPEKKSVILQINSCSLLILFRYSLIMDLDQIREILKNLMQRGLYGSVQINLHDGNIQNLNINESIIDAKSWSENNQQLDGIPKKYYVVFSQCNNREPYRLAQNESLVELFSQYDDIDFSIADAQGDEKKQIIQIDRFIKRKPDIIIIAPIEREPLNNVIKNAFDRGIKIILLERDISGDHFTSFVGCNNYEIGTMAGKFITALLENKYGEPKGNIIEIRGLLDVEGEINRYNGAHKILDNHNKIKVINEVEADWSERKAREQVHAILKDHENVDVIFGHNDSMAIGAYLAAQDLGIADNIFFVGVDGLEGRGGGKKQVIDGILSASFSYPLCTDRVVEISNKILRDPNYKPEKNYILNAEMLVSPSLLHQLNVFENSLVKVPI